MNQQEVFTGQELLAIRFYMGDAAVAGSGLFKGGPQAYNTINALMHPGASNEKDKAGEGRVIMLEDASHLKSYLELILDIYRAMEKYRKFCLCQTAGRAIGQRAGDDSGSSGQQMELSGRSGHLLTYRVDRLTSLQRFEADNHRVAGFFSTCKRGFLPEYAHNKAKVAMMEVERDETVPFLDFEDIFEDCYAKPEEAEILLPFGMVIQQMEALPVTQQEAEQFTDINGRPPAGKWRLHLTMGRMPKLSETELRVLYEAVNDEKTIKMIIGCMEKLTARTVLTAEEEAFYSSWKRQLQRYITGCIGNMRRTSA